VNTSIEIRHGGTHARILPEIGFSCDSFQVDGFDYLHRPQDWPATPTHGGIPVLFPWPNRIARASFTWEGSSYALPVTEPATGASLHGFACHAPWRVLDAQPDRVTGEFILSRDAPELAAAWPADAALRLTYRVGDRSLTAEATVYSADRRPLPFGLGFHPYLRVPGAFDQWTLQCDAGLAWPLSGMVPTGSATPVPPRVDFRRARPIGREHLDDVLTGLPAATSMTRRAELASPEAVVRVWSDPAFRDYVVFTPTTRDSVAIEPYTCTTDAANLAVRGVETGWRVLPGDERAHFEWRLDVG
jgi:aldose 1-epimerase